MAIFKRISVFLMVNFLVILSLSAIYLIISMFLPVGFFSEDIGMGIPPALIVFCLVFGFGGAFISLWMSKFLAKKLWRVKIIDETSPQHGWIVNTTHRLARKAGLKKMPEVGYYESPEVNAFATGPSKNNSLVAVSAGLLHHMNKDEVEGVLGHEVAHIANGDMVTMALVQGIVNSVVILAAHIITNIIENFFRDEESGHGGLGFFARFFIYQAVYSLLAFAAMPVVAFVSRMREYRADAGGATLAGREKMLAGIKALKNCLIDTQHESFATLKISNKPKASLLRFWSTHPPLDDRIARLERGAYRNTL